VHWRSRQLRPVSHGAELLFSRPGTRSQPLRWSARTAPVPTMQPPLRGSPRPEPRTADHRCGAFFRNKLRDDRIYSIAGHRRGPHAKAGPGSKPGKPSVSFPSSGLHLAALAFCVRWHAMRKVGGSALGSVSVGADFMARLTRPAETASTNGSSEGTATANHSGTGTSASASGTGDADVARFCTAPRAKK
jgi:hypothetical protein